MIATVDRVPDSPKQMLAGDEHRRPGRLPAIRPPGGEECCQIVAPPGGRLAERER